MKKIIEDLIGKEENDDIKIEELKSNKPEETYWASFWLNSPKPYPPNPRPPAIGITPKQDYKRKAKSDYTK